MSPEAAFLLMLALRMAITAAFVVTASMIHRTFRPGDLARLIATLPISAGTVLCVPRARS